MKPIASSVIWLRSAAAANMYSPIRYLRPDSMSYYIYHIKQSTDTIVKQLQLVSKFDNYSLAKSEIRKLRATLPRGNGELWKMVFAESELQAEEILQEKRQEPILMEWEK